MSSFSNSDEYLTEVFTQLRNALGISFEEFYDLILPMVLCPDVIEDNREELEALKKLASKTANTDAYIKATDACMDFNVENQLSKINIPTLILAGHYDNISLPDSQRKIHEKISNSKFVIFENTKHNLLVGKNNQKILDILKDFFTGQL
jgi:3-oxoadipate enol-lactonase